MDETDKKIFKILQLSFYLGITAKAIEGINEVLKGKEGQKTKKKREGEERIVGYRIIEGGENEK